MNSKPNHPAIINIVMIDNEIPEVDMNVAYDDYEYKFGDGFYAWIPDATTEYSRIIVPFRYNKTSWCQVGFTRNLSGIDGIDAQREFLNVLNSVLPDNVEKPTRIENKNHKNLTIYL